MDFLWRDGKWNETSLFFTKKSFYHVFSSWSITLFMFNRTSLLYSGTFIIAISCVLLLMECVDFTIHVQSYFLYIFGNFHYCNFVRTNPDGRRWFRYSCSIVLPCYIRELSLLQFHTYYSWWKELISLVMFNRTSFLCLGTLIIAISCVLLLMEDVDW